MDKSQFLVKIPFEIGDIIAPEGYINKYEIIDIVTVHYTKTKMVDVILSLKDTTFGFIGYYKLNDFKWKLVTNLVEEE